MISRKAPKVAKNAKFCSALPQDAMIYQWEFFIANGQPEKRAQAHRAELVIPSAVTGQRAEPRPRAPN